MQQLHTWYEFGIHWILAIIAIATVTVSICATEQQKLLHASSHPATIAMKQTGEVRQE